MGKSARIGLSLVLAVLGAGVAMWAFTTLMSQPETIAFAAGPSNQVNVTLEAVGSMGTGDPNHPTFVSYLVQDPSGGWKHTTLFQVPANTAVHMTIYQFDSGSPLRNQQIGQVTGTDGGTATTDGHKFSVLNSYDTNGVGHTFSIPAIGLSVPLAGNPGDANICVNAPCAQSWPHTTTTFTFTSPGPGSYPWQCFVPCGLGYLFGNGGGMSTLGYMGGFMKVTA